MTFEQKLRSTVSQGGKSFKYKGEVYSISDATESDLKTYQFGGDLDRYGVASPLASVGNSMYQMQTGGTLGTDPQQQQLAQFATLFGLPSMGTPPPITAPQIPLMQKKTGFWNTIGKGLGFVPRNGDVDMQNKVIQAKNTEMMDIEKQKIANLPNPNTNMLSQLPQIMSLFSSLANLKEGGELMVNDGIDLSPNIPIQAEVNNGVPEMIQTQRGLSPVRARKGHEDMPDGLITDIGAEGDYVYSAHKKTAQNWGDVPVFAHDGGEYEEGIKGELPSLVTVGGLLSANKKETPARIAAMISKRYPYKEPKEGDVDYNDPYANKAYSENNKFRDTILERVKQTAEERKQRAEGNSKTLVNAQWGGLLGAGTEVVGNIVNMVNARKNAREQKKFLEGQRGIYNKAFDDRKGALGSSASLDQLTALSMDTDVNRKQVDRSILDRYSPERANTIQNNASGNTYADLVNSLRSNPNMDSVTKSNALAKMAAGYYGETSNNALNYTTDTKSFESARQALNQAELDNRYGELEMERELGNQQRSMIGNRGSGNILDQSAVDFNKVEMESTIQQAILDADKARRNAVGQGIANIGSSLTKGFSSFGKLGGNTLNSNQQLPASTMQSFRDSIGSFKIPNTINNPYQTLNTNPNGFNFRVPDLQSMGQFPVNAGLAEWLINGGNYGGINFGNTGYKMKLGPR